MVAFHERCPNIEFWPSQPNQFYSFFFVLRPEIRPKWIFSLVTLTCNRRTENFSTRWRPINLRSFSKKNFFFQIEFWAGKKAQKSLTTFSQNRKLSCFYVKRLFIQYHLMISETRGCQCPLGSFHCNSYAYFLTLPIIIKYLCKWVTLCLMFNDHSFKAKTRVFVFDS